MKPRRPSIKDSLQKMSLRVRAEKKQAATAAKAARKAAKKKAREEEQEDFNQATVRAFQEVIRRSEALPERDKHSLSLVTGR